jgi:hypothetical protein
MGIFDVVVVLDETLRSCATKGSGCCAPGPPVAVKREPSLYTPPPWTPLPSPASFP